MTGHASDRAACTECDWASYGETALTDALFHEQVTGHAAIDCQFRKWYREEWKP